MTVGSLRCSRARADMPSVTEIVKQCVSSKSGACPGLSRRHQRMYSEGLHDCVSWLEALVCWSPRRVLTRLNDWQSRAQMKPLKEHNRLRKSFGWPLAGRYAVAGLNHESAQLPATVCGNGQGTSCRRQEQAQRRNPGCHSRACRSLWRCCYCI